MIGDHDCPKCGFTIEEDWFVEVALPVEDAMAYGDVTFHCPFCGVYLKVDVEMSITLEIFKKGD